MYRIILVVLVLVFAGLQYRLWIGEGSLAEIHRIHHKSRILAESNTEAEARNNSMQKQITHLKSNKSAAEGRARDEMGMIKPGETFFLTEPGDGETAAPADNSASAPGH